MNFEWELVHVSGDVLHEATYRAKVPGGWLIRFERGYDSDPDNDMWQRWQDTLTFIPDLHYQWTIES